MSKFYDIAEQHRQHLEDLGSAKREIMRGIEETEPNIHPVTLRNLAEEQITATYPSGLQRYGYSIGHKALAWFAIGDMHVDAMQNAETPPPEKKIHQYSEIRTFNRNALELGSAWYARVYSQLWDEQAACSMNERTPASLEIGKFDPYAVEEQAWITGLITAMSSRLQRAGASLEHEASVSFTVPRNNWEVELSRPATRFGDQHHMLIAESHGSNLRQTRVTEYYVSATEEKAWGNIILPDESRARLTGLTALGLASDISADIFETIALQNALDPIARRARYFAAAEQAA